MLEGEVAGDCVLVVDQVGNGGPAAERRERCIVCMLCCVVSLILDVCTYTFKW